MAFSFTLVNTNPAGTDLISLGDDNIRDFKSAVLERVNSRFVDVNSDPWVIKEPVAGTGNTRTLIPVADNAWSLGENARRWAQIYGMDMRGSTRIAGPIQDYGGVEYSVKHPTFGAVSDWNGATGTDNSPMIAAALAALPTKGGTVYIPDGDYKCASSLVPPSSNPFMNGSHHRILLGRSARLVFTSAAAGAALIDISNPQSIESTFTIEEGILDGTYASATAIGVNIHTQNVKIRRVAIKYFKGSGLRYVYDLAAPPICSEVQGCRIFYCGVGIDCGVSASLLFLQGNRIEGNDREGVSLADCAHFCLSGNTIENNGQVTAASSNLKIRGKCYGMIDGNYFESNAYQGHTNVSIEGTAGQPGGISFCANIITGYFETSSGSGVALTTAIGLAFGTTGATETVVTRGNLYFGMWKGVLIGAFARGYSVGPDHFSDNFAPTFVTPPCFRYDFSGVGYAGSVYDQNRWVGKIYHLLTSLESPTLNLMTATGLANFQGGVKVTGGVSVNGSMVKDSAGGLTFQGVLGSIYDYLETVPGGALLSGTPTGTTDEVKAGHMKLGTAGKGIFMKDGPNNYMGVAGIVAGTVTVANNKVTANSRIFLTRSLNFSATFGHLRYSINPGVSFTITSTDATENSNVNYLIVEPS